jgi:3-oxoacyl-[acyl-carrier protein] reductase
MEITLKDKIALVTGGGAGIGRAIADAFGDLGATVVVAEIDPARVEATKKALDAKGVKNLVLRADVRNTAEVKTVMARIASDFGRLNVLVNNVGDSLKMRGEFADSTEEGWDQLYDINLRHVMLVSLHAIPLLRKGGTGGSIINISSIEGVRGLPLGAVYAAFKAGVVNFTRSLACELGPDDIRVNCIGPETTETEQVPIPKLVKPEHQQYIKRWFPLGRYGKAEDCAGAAVYLATDMSRWTTGQTIVLDGGAMAGAGWRMMADGRWTNSPITHEAHWAYGNPKP